MRVGLVALLVLGPLGVAAGVTATGCDPLPACATEAEIAEGRRLGIRVDGRDCPDAGADAGGDAKPPPPECFPSDENLSPANDICGVFVSSLGSDSEQAGTRKERPVKTLARALELAAKGEKRVVYMCGGETFETPESAEDVSVPAGFTIYGGLNCDSAEWPFSDGTTKTTVTAPADRVPLRLAGGAGVTELHDVRIVAQSATVPSGSSIAVIAEDVTATFYRSELVAGNGADGVSGEPYLDVALAGENGVAPTAAACSASLVPGGEGPMNMCSAGGTGGPGSTTEGFSGASGLPDGLDNGGAGEQGPSGCKDGSNGENGVDGAPGAAVTELGKLDSATGYTGIAGPDGEPGAAGRGGGGGGGSKSIVTGMNKCPGGTGGGASGGSGASGGCGGLGGRGGGPGGASIAVVSLRSKLTFDASKLVLGSGGQPGSGSNGQDGGLGGSAGGAGGTAPAVPGLKPGCKGGRGGNGGRGGAGADGLGGHVIGVAFIAPMPDMEPAFRNMSDADVALQGEPGLNGGVKMKAQSF